MQIRLCSSSLNISRSGKDCCSGQLESICQWPQNHKNLSNQVLHTPNTSQWSYCPQQPSDPTSWPTSCALKQNPHWHLFLALGSKLFHAAFCRHGSLVASCQHYLWTNMNFSTSSNLDRHRFSLHNKPDHYPPLAAPSRLGTTKHPKLSLSHGYTPSLFAAITAVHTASGTLGNREQSALPMASSQEGQMSLAALLPSQTAQSQFPLLILLPATPGQCQQQSLLSPVHLIYTQHCHFLSWSHPCSSSHHFQFLD